MDRHLKTIVFFSRTGCLLPVLLLLNLFFGWMFFGVRIWLAVELGLLLLFIINSVIITKKISKFSQSQRSEEKVVDVEGEVVDENQHLPPPTK